MFGWRGRQDRETRLCELQRREVAEGLTDTEEEELERLEQESMQTFVRSAAAPARPDFWTHLFFTRRRRAG